MKHKFINDNFVISEEVIPYAELLELCYHHGENAVNLVQKGGVENLSPDEKKHFIRQCHEGWKIAQVIIVQKILELEYEQILIRKEVNGKIHKQTPKKKYIYNVLERHKQRLRDLANGIVWHIYKMDKSRIRAGVVADRPHGFLKDKNIQSYSTYIDQANSNPDSFALIGDITTVLGTADILQVDKEGVALIEVKEGKINEELSEILHKNKGQPEQLINEVFEKYGSDTTTLKQFERRLKQEIRASLSMQYEEDKTSRIDHMLQETIRVVELNHVDQYYLSEFENICSKAISSSSMESGVIDDCLYVVAQRGSYNLEMNFLIRHDIYHRFYTKECFAKDNNEKQQQEFSMINKIRIERLDSAFAIPGMIPVTLWLSTIDQTIAQQIMSGELKIFTYLHIPSFVELAEKMDLIVSYKKAKHHTPLDKCNFTWGNKNILFDNMNFVNTGYIEICCGFNTPKNILQKIKLSVEDFRTRRLE